MCTQPFLLDSIIHHFLCRWDNSIADVLLFDEGMTVHTGIQMTGLHHGIKINTRSRYTIYIQRNHSTYARYLPVQWCTSYIMTMETDGQTHTITNNSLPTHIHGYGQLNSTSKVYLLCQCGKILMCQSMFYFLACTGNFCSNVPHMELWSEYVIIVHRRLDCIDNHCVYIPAQV